ncbi:hypothetical protein Pve01_86140 [Planomonospora venezuelensis]|nr:hypothetical protein Pve01_86140 [Planomonospora venezuelensis]
MSWDLSVVCNNMALKGLQVQFTYEQTGGGKTALLSSVVVSSFSPAASWSSSITKASMVATASATYAGPDIAQGTTANIHVQFQGTDNSQGKVGATLMARDSKGNLVALGTIDPREWTSGSAHSH